MIRQTSFYIKYIIIINDLLLIFIAVSGERSDAAHGIALVCSTQWNGSKIFVQFILYTFYGFFCSIISSDWLQ